eukprot:gene10001-8875_t
MLPRREVYLLSCTLTVCAAPGDMPFPVCNCICDSAGPTTLAAFGPPPARAFFASLSLARPYMAPAVVTLCPDVPRGSPDLCAGV